MKRLAIIVLFLMSSLWLSAQEWIIPVDGEAFFKFWDVIPVDEGESVLGIGCIRTEDGYIAKISKDGNVTFNEIHLPGMMLEYFTAVQLDNGNFMAFGVCDDSLCDYHIQKYLRVDVFNDLLEIVSSRTYCVDDDVFDCFYEPRWGYSMRSIVSKTGKAVLVARLAYYVENNYGGYYNGALRFYEFDGSGDMIRYVDQVSLTYASAGGIKEITYAPNSDNYMVFMQGGEFPPHSGCIGVYVADADYRIVARQHMLHFGENETVTDNNCEGKWIDGNRLIVDIERYIGTSFKYHTLFVTDSALNIYAKLRLPPYDSCTWVPYGTNTAYINDSTIFAMSYCSERMFSEDVQQVNVTLVDKHLNLLGRKVIKRDDVFCFVSPPAAFNDGGCMVLISSRNGSNYPGTPFNKYELMKFRREDIEITWDVINETVAIPTLSAYPNPAASSLNIPIDVTMSNNTRIQIFDAKGAKCLDSEVGDIGNLITLDIHNLDSGLYIYKVVSENHELASGKFVKK